MKVFNTLAGKKEEFLPQGEEVKMSKRAGTYITIDEVIENENYALIITTNSGLWRYLIGDTVKVTSKYPFRIKVAVSIAIY